MPRGRVFTAEAAELAVGTVKPRAHGSDPRPHDASDLPVSEAVDISEIHDRARVFAERLAAAVVSGSVSITGRYPNPGPKAATRRWRAAGHRLTD